MLHLIFFLFIFAFFNLLSIEKDKNNYELKIKELNEKNEKDKNEYEFKIKELNEEKGNENNNYEIKIKELNEEKKKIKRIIIKFFYYLYS